MSSAVLRCTAATRAALWIHSCYLTFCFNDFALDPQLMCTVLNYSPSGLIHHL